MLWYKHHHQVQSTDEDDQAASWECNAATVRLVEAAISTFITTSENPGIVYGKLIVASVMEAGGSAASEQVKRDVRI